MAAKVNLLHKMNLYKYTIGEKLLFYLQHRLNMTFQTFGNEIFIALRRLSYISKDLRYDLCNKVNLGGENLYL